MSALELGLLEVYNNRLLAHPKNLWLEFGVFRGTSTRRLLNVRKNLQTRQQAGLNKQVYGFDSFQGLPEDWRQPMADTFNPERIARLFLRRGSFNLYGRPPFNDSAIGWITGWFNQSLPEFLHEKLGNVSFLHIDSDLYSSASTVLTLLGKHNRLHSGTVIVFDELINYPEFREGELKAVCEFLSIRGWSLRVLGTGASIVLHNSNEIISHVKLQKNARETPHVGRYRQDAAFVVVRD